MDLLPLGVDPLFLRMGQRWRPKVLPCWFYAGGGPRWRLWAAPGRRWRLRWELGSSAPRAWRRRLRLLLVVVVFTGGYTIRGDDAYGK